MCGGIAQDDNLHITIAGLSKSNGVEYMLNACNGDKSFSINFIKRLL